MYHKVCYRIKVSNSVCKQWGRIHKNHTPAKCNIHYYSGYENGVANIPFNDSATSSMATTVLFSSCKSGAPFEIQVSVENSVSASAGAKVLQIFSWGFTAKVWRDSGSDTLPIFEPILLRWKAFYGEILMILALCGKIILIYACIVGTSSV